MLIVDDFLPNPELEYETAGSIKYRDYLIGDQTFPHFAVTEDNHSVKRISELVGEELVLSLAPMYRYYLSSDKQPTYIHQDEYEADIAVVVFLNKENENNGLAFWTKLDAEFKLDEVIMAKFNRAVIFDAKDWHSRYPESGWVVENGVRLVKLFFLRRVKR